MIDLKLGVDSVVMNNFPYVGEGNVDIGEIENNLFREREVVDVDAIIPDNAQQAQMLKMIQEEDRKEKKQESQASSVNE